MLVITVIAIVLLLIAAAALYFFSESLAEFGPHFLYITGALLLIVLGIGIYLSLAVPSIAKSNPFAQQNAPPTVTQDSPVGIPLQSE